MVEKGQIPIDQKITLDEINFLIKHEHNSRVMKSFIFIQSKELMRNIIRNEFTRISTSFIIFKEMDGNIPSTNQKCTLLKAYPKTNFYL